MRLNSNKFISRDVKNYYIYFLFLNKILIYIGQTLHLNARLVAHKGKRRRQDPFNNYTPYKKYTHYRYIESHSDYLSKKWEKILIKKWNPKYNIGHNNDARFYKVWVKKKRDVELPNGRRKRILGHWRYLEK
jgi:excinuclease UvrABC nuclease subunit|tara:strand:+ start:40 stop:435 length:396 start_codon:yes stop_codon:yes gene_type:complete